MSDSNTIESLATSEVTRRRLLQGVGASLLVVGGGSIISACGGGSSSSGTGTVASASEGKPVAGGVLRIGAQGGSNTDTLDANQTLTNTDFARAAQLYDPLLRLSSEGHIENVLAESVTPNSTATEWTVKLRQGVKFHDGSEFTAKDVLFTFNRVLVGKYSAAITLGSLELNASKAVDEHTLLLKFGTPYSFFAEAIAARFETLYMVPVGYDPKKPIGCGPFKLVSFTPGRESVTVKFDEYWDSPKPYLDEIRTINVNEESAQVSALQAGQVDCIDNLTAASVAALQGAGQHVSISKSAGWTPLCMAVDKAPFTDNRVREAMKLVVDRKGMIESVFSGNGNIANDYFGTLTPAVQTVHLPQHEQDLEKVKSLLKAAGQSSLNLQLYTSEIAPGMEQTAEVLATQAEAAGIKITVVKQPSTEYFARSYLKVPFGMDYWPYQPYLVAAGQANVTGGVFSFTKFNSPTYDKYYKEATSTIDAAKQEEIIHEMVKIDYSEGGNIIPYNFPVIDAWSPKVHGIVPSELGYPLGNFQFKNVWLS
jgi:peptide/nickel transport system substrate-binding protein